MRSFFQTTDGGRVSSPAMRGGDTAPPVVRTGGKFCSGYTLVEVLAALLFMAIVIPVAMHGVSVASRAGTLGQRKSAAVRVAERVLDEAYITGQLGTTATNGTTTDGDTTYAWTLQTAAWTEDTMTTAT